ncbi:MAG: SufD family Fe-S cluster assembly protein [Candidatus Omnitrophica bacterium]|nr:SufD family Fe-S cluster assembly protein [Candidatus Omnitrophota bacterium]
MKNVKNAMEKKMKEFEEANYVGYDFNEKQRAGSFFQKDNEILLSKSLYEGIEILAIEEAIKKYPEVKEKYYGKGFEKISIDFEKETEGGYFIRVKKGVKVIFPIQVCLYLKKNNFKQKIHNIVVVEEKAEVYIITGCTNAKETENAYHLGISEFFVHSGGFLNFTMIHSWKEDITVEPKGVTVVEKDGIFVSNYISLKPVKKITMYPCTILEGENSKARFSSIIISYPNSYHDVGSKCILANKNTSAEIISRSVNYGGTVIARGHIKAISPYVRGHLECKGLLLTEKGTIYAIPELETLYQDVDLTHEAAIGKIKKEEIEYLASRGIPEEEAQSLIIRGFINIEILGLPDIIEKEITKILNKI